MRVMSEEPTEQIGLPVTGIVFGSFGLLLSWIPYVNYFALILAIVGLMFTIISFIINRHVKKVLTYVSLGLTVSALLISGMMHVAIVKWIDPTPTVNKTELAADDRESSSNSTTLDDEDVETEKSEDIDTQFQAVMMAYDTFNENIQRASSKVSSMSGEEQQDIVIDLLQEQTEVMAMESELESSDLSTSQMMKLNNKSVNIMRSYDKLQKQIEGNDY